MSYVTEICGGNELIIEKKIISRFYIHFLLIQTPQREEKERSNQEITSIRAKMQLKGQDVVLVCELQGLGIEPTTFRTGGELLFWDLHKPGATYHDYSNFKKKQRRNVSM